MNLHGVLHLYGAENLKRRLTPCSERAFLASTLRVKTRADADFAPFRAADYVQSLSLRGNRRLPYAAGPTLASLLELELFTQGTSWEAIATDSVARAGVT
jgi:hypothetical protein